MKGRRFIKKALPPYRLKTLNAKNHLRIETYDGGNEGLHPSCLYFHDGWNGHRFWFVFTPYKDMNDAIENPCIYCSDNGTDFTPIPTANPLDDISLPKEQEYNSDPELVYNPDLDRIECWWRRVQRDCYPTEDGKNREIIYRSCSYNGNDWSEKETILDYKNPFNETRGVISPAVIYEDGVYRMWASTSDDYEGKSRYISYYVMTEDTPLTLQNRISLGKHKISHLDVVKLNEVYNLIGFDVQREGNPYYLFSSSKPDSAFTCQGLILTSGKKGHWDDRVLYRPSISIVENELWLYYSAYQKKKTSSSHVGLIRFKHFDELKECFLWKKNIFAQKA